MKKLKFAAHLVPLVLNKSKTITWRINDDKSLSCQDILALIHAETLKEFGKAKVLWVKETTFGNLSEEDREGHEKFQSLEEMYDTYLKYYNIKITKDTILKVVKFKLL